MNIINIVLLDLTNILLPLAIYLLYTAYSNTFSKKENNLVFMFMVFTMIYMILKNGTHSKDFPLILINIPLILTYLKKSNMAIITTSFIIIYYYISYFEEYKFLIILEYLLYYLIYMINYKNFNINKFIIIFTIIKAVMLNLYVFFKNNLNYQTENEIIISIVLFIMLSMFITLFNRKTEDMLKLHLKYKEIQKDKQIKTSLFQITHEIKNPIAVCKGYLDMFDPNNPEHAQKYIPIIKEEINRTLLLLEDFLAMNKIKIQKDIVDINLILEDVLESTKLLFDSNKIKLINNISDDEIYINGDYNRLIQVFVNLLKNSCEAKGVSQIKIWTENSKDKVKIFIKDNGEGMDKNTINKIKEPFYTTKVKGTGLGVSLSSEIITAHGGSLNYKSKIKEYTLVTVILPIKKAY